MPADTQETSSLSILEQQAAVVSKVDAGDFPAAVALGRSFVVDMASLFGVDSIIVVRAVCILALALDYLKPEGRREAETWAHMAMMAVLKDVMADDPPFYMEDVPDDFLVDHIRIMREVFPKVWERRDSFQWTGTPDFGTGTLIPFGDLKIGVRQDPV